MVSQGISRDDVDSSETGNQKQLRSRPSTPTHNVCTLVSIAIRRGLTEFGLPGRPYGMAKEMVLECENCSLRS